MIWLGRSSHAVKCEDRQCTIELLTTLDWSIPHLVVKQGRAGRGPHRINNDEPVSLTYIHYVAEDFLHAIVDFGGDDEQTELRVLSRSFSEKMAQQNRRGLLDLWYSTI